MHQPEYREFPASRYRLPWTLLHALKDYVDMAAHLEAEPDAKAVVNFAPVLLEQIADYAIALGRHLRSGAPLPDPLLAAVAGHLPVDPAARRALLLQCLRANRQRVIARFPAWERLCDLAGRVGLASEDLDWLSDTYLLDLAVWYLLGWLGETVRRDDPRVARLQRKARGFDATDRRELLHLVQELLEGVLPRYRALALAGRVELAMSPFAHPILPLLLDLGAGLESEPGGLRPQAEVYPGGEARARWQLRHGREVFRRLLGVEPAGCWPSEGAISEATVRLLAEEGFRWCASGEGVLRNSLRASEAPQPGDACLHRVYALADEPLRIFFRDDGISDLIGFRYADWHADDAVANLIHHLGNIADACPDRRNCAISVILDGENAWEYYPENAIHFLSALYRELARHPRFALTTFSELLSRRQPEPARLARLVAGSWVYGTLSTWVGSPDKNRGWEMLVAAKACFDRAVAEGRFDEATRRAAERQLAVCEGSDWFWWFGDYNPAESVSDFEQLFRAQLAALYRLCGEALPASLDTAVSAGHGDPAHGGVMRPGAAV